MLQEVQQSEKIASHEWGNSFSCEVLSSETDSSTLH